MSEARIEAIKANEVYFRTLLDGTFTVEYGKAMKDGPYWVVPFRTLIISTIDDSCPLSEIAKRRPGAFWLLYYYSTDKSLKGMRRLLTRSCDLYKT